MGRINESRIRYAKEEKMEEGNENKVNEMQ
jgi:hypothetical protein